jgi:hypothetical protein
MIGVQYLVSVIDNQLATEGSKHCNRKVEVRPFL